MKVSHGPWWIAVHLLATCGISHALPPHQIFEHVSPSVWSVKAYGADGKLLASASGLAITPGKLVTSCQVLARAREVKLRRGREIHGARLEFPDTERDLCQFDVPGLSAPVLAQESARTLRPGQRIYVIGFSIGDEASIVEGLVSAVRDSGTQKERIQTSVPAMRGLLGAGVFDQEGRLVGVVTSSPKEAAATAFAVPADWLAELAARGQAALAARAKPATARTGIPEAGSQWAYGLTDRLYGRPPIDVTVRVTRVDGSSIDESVISRGSGQKETQRTVSAGDAKFLPHALADGAELMEFAPYLLAASGAEAALVPVSAAGYPAGAGFPEWIARTGPQAWEQVTVPAGTFKALRLEINGRRARVPSDPNVSRTFLVRVWYAPEAQRYVRLEQKEWSIPGRQLSHVVVELTKFSPPR